MKLLVSLPESVPELSKTWEEMLRYAVGPSPLLITIDGLDEVWTALTGAGSCCSFACVDLASVTNEISLTAKGIFLEPFQEISTTM